jgi:M6 family metalloprotease-like protein
MSETAILNPVTEAAASEQRQTDPSLTFRASSAFRKLLATAGVIVAAGAFAPAAMADYDPLGGQEHSGALGDHKLAVVLVDFNDDPSQPFTAEEVDEALFTGPDSVSDYYKNASFGQLHLEGKYNPDGDVFDWVKVPSFLHRSCEEGDFARVGLAANAAVKKATGKSLAGYDNYMYILPRRTNCINGNNGQVVNGSTYGNTTFINSRDNENFEGVDVHELGHEFGLSHANDEHCRDNEGDFVAPPVGSNRGCTYVIYQDPFDPMGGGRLSLDAPIDFDGLNKARLGWLKPENIKTVKHNSIVDIAPDELPSDQTQLVQIPYKGKYGNTRYLYLDYRQPLGEDAAVAPDNPMFQGITIRKAAGIDRNKLVSLGDYTTLIDAHPATVTALDAPLDAGETYHAGKTGITVKALKTDKTGAIVSVTFAK